MKKLLFVLTLFFSLTSLASPLWMRYPSISPDGSKIAFTYQGDIFVVNTSGGTALQITSHKSIDYMPIWSNDGTKIAFASNRHGNFDIFSIPQNGGHPTRLTFHSANDYPYTFSNDDKKILFSSSRLDDKNSVQFPYARLSELYSVPTTGGREHQELTIAAEDVKYSQDGKTLIFHNKKGYEDPWRKHHTSSVTRDIVTYNTDSKIFKQITNWNGEDRLL